MSRLIRHFLVQLHLCVVVFVLLISVPSTVDASGFGAGGHSSFDDTWVYSAEQINELRKSYPDADAVILRLSVIVEMEESGTVKRSFLRRVALLTDNAIRRYGDPRILFDTGTQELDVSVARVYMRDGKKMDCRENAFNQTTPYPFALTPDYTNWQEMVVTHIGIEKGCVAELQYTIRSKKKTKPWISGFEYLAHDDPVLVSEFSLVLPPGTPLKHVSLNGGPEPELPSDGIYKWKLEKVPAIPPVNGGVWRGDYVPAVLFSTAGSWDEVLGYVNDMFTGSANTSFSREKIPGSEITEETIFEIHSDALDCVRGIHPPFGIFGSPPRSAEQIYQSAYAHSLDRAILLKEKLGEKGIESVPVLLSAGRTCPEDVPALELFDRVFLEVRFGESVDTYLLDPENRFLRDPKMMNPGKKIARCFGEGEIIRLPEGISKANKSSLNLKLTLNEENKLTGEGSAAMTGIFSPYYSVKGVKTEMEDFLTNRVRNLLPAASLKSWNIRTLEKGCVEIGFHFEAELPEETEAGRIYLTFPEPFMSEVNGADGIYIERSEYPVPIRVLPCNLEVSVEFGKLPGWELFGTPHHTDEENAVGRVKTSADKILTDSGSTLAFSKNLAIGKEIAFGEDYRQLRSLLLNYGGGQIILKRSEND